MEKKTIKVVCAVIIRKKKLFIAQRDYGEFKGMYEFPGGKVESNETKEDAIKREILEELDTKIEVERFLFNETYEYSSFILDMDCFLCTPIDGNLSIEKGIHSDEKWIERNEGSSIHWCPADNEVFNKLIELDII